MVNYILAGLLLIAAVGFYIPTQLWLMGKLHWGDSDDYGFWGSLSWTRKYKLVWSAEAVGWIQTGFPKFWQSDGLLVFVTDGYHLFQFIQFRCIAGAVALLTPWPWTVFAVLFCGFPICSWLFQKLLTR